MNGKKIRMVLLVATMAFACLITVFVYFKFISIINVLGSELAQLQGSYDVLNEKSKKADFFNYELKYIQYENEQIQKILPPDIRQEDVIMALRRIELASGAKMSEIQFSELASATKEKTEKRASSTEKKSEEAPKDESSEKPKDGQEDPVTEETKPQVRFLPINSSEFKDGEKIYMKVGVSFRAPYSKMKEMLKEIAHEKNRVIINNISVHSSDKDNLLTGSVELTFWALKDSSRTVREWELQLEKGMEDLFKPFDGYVENTNVVMPVVNNLKKEEKPQSDFYLLASPFNKLKPTVLIGKYESINSEIFYDGNELVDINLYIEEVDGHFYYRTRTKYMPFPDESTSVLFFPKQKDITMDIIASSVSGDSDKARVRLNVYNNTDKRVSIIQDDFSERVTIVAKQGTVIKTKKR